jgi:antitoxin (DNA-binding transcriptional repressor) of toxin-antitoxin stability system
MEIKDSRISLGKTRIFTMRELNQHTAAVLQEINSSGRPALVTRHGRFIAMITPLEGAMVESLVLPRLASEAAARATDKVGTTSEELLSQLQDEDD